MRSRVSMIMATVLLCVAPTAGWCALGPYSQDFEGLDQADPAALANDGWTVYNNVFHVDGWYWYGYGPYAAPNGGEQWSAIASGEGGPDQGEQQLSVYSDYWFWGHGDGHRVEVNVFQEQTIGAENAGETWLFEFDAKRGNIGGVTTARAFIKTLDPANGYITTNFISVDMTDVPVTWGSYLLSIVIDSSLDGQLLQIGFMNTTTYWNGSGIFYDNIRFRPATKQCHQVSADVGSDLGIVEVCSKSQADDLAAGEQASVCVDANQDEVSCGGACADGNCGCIVENFWAPRNNYHFKKACTSAPVTGCPGDKGYVCDFSSVSYTCPCACRLPGDPGGTSDPGCMP